MTAGFFRVLRNPFLRTLTLTPAVVHRDWAVNNPPKLARVLKTLAGIQQGFNDAQAGGRKRSLADLIVLGGCAAVEKAAKDGGHDVNGPSLDDFRNWLIRPHDS